MTFDNYTLVILCGYVCLIVALAVGVALRRVRFPSIKVWVSASILMGLALILLVIGIKLVDLKSQALGFAFLTLSLGLQASVFHYEATRQWLSWPIAWVFFLPIFFSIFTLQISPPTEAVVIISRLIILFSTSVVAVSALRLAQQVKWPQGSTVALIYAGYSGLILIFITRWYFIVGATDSTLSSLGATIFTLTAIITIVIVQLSYLALLHQLQHQNVLDNVERLSKLDALIERQSELEISDRRSDLLERAKALSHKFTEPLKTIMDTSAYILRNQALMTELETKNNFSIIQDQSFAINQELTSVRNSLAAATKARTLVNISDIIQQNLRLFSKLRQLNHILVNDTEVSPLIDITTDRSRFNHLILCVLRFIHEHAIAEHLPQITIVTANSDEGVDYVLVTAKGQVLTLDAHWTAIPTPELKSLEPINLFLITHLAAQLGGQHQFLAGPHGGLGLRLSLPKALGSETNQ